MPPIVARFIFAIAAIVATPAVYLICVVGLEQLAVWRYSMVFLFAALPAGLFFIWAWILIWRSFVNWTRQRRVLTTGSVFAATGAAFLLYLIIRGAVNGGHDVSIVISEIAWLGIWIVMTAHIWRETPVERAARLAPGLSRSLCCPKCGYQLTGLTEARCPECGTQYTLDELFAANTPVSEDLADKT